MRIGKRAACVLIAVITAVTLAWAQQDQTFLNDLLTELDDQPVTHGEPSAVLAANDVVPDATSAATGSGGGGEDVLAAILGEDSPTKHSSEAETEEVEAAEDLLDDLLSDSGGEQAEEGAAADASSGTGGIDIDELLAGFEESTEEEPEAVEEVDAGAAALAEATAATVEEGPAPVPDLSLGEKKALADQMAKEEAAQRRHNAKEGALRLQEGLDSLAAQDYETAIAQFDSALILLPDIAMHQEDRESAKWGHAEADFQIARSLFKEKKAKEALSAADKGLSYSPNHRGLTRLRGAVEKYLEKHPGEPRVLVAQRPETVALASSINDLLIEGRDLYKNGKIDEAEVVFEQIRLLDRYNTEAMRYLKILEERKYKLANVARERTIADYNEDVRSRWNPPLKTDIEKPEIGMPGDDAKTIVTDADTEEMIAKMKEMVIPSLEFRSANIIDVVEELRDQSRKIDPQADGINIVLKLTAPRRDFDGGLDGQSAGLDGMYPGGPARPGGFGGPGSGGYLPPGSSGYGPEPEFGSFDAGGEFGDEFGGFDDEFGGADPFDDPGGGFNDEGTFQTTTDVEVPQITLVLRRISLYDALQIITEYADLKFKIENRIVFITPSGLEEMETRVYAVQPSMLEVIVETGDSDGSGGRGGGGGRSGGGGGGGGEFIEIGRPVEFRRPDVAAFFRRAGVPIPRGASMTYNPSTSQIVHRNIIENLDIFERLLPKFNVPPTQVEIEARFVEIIQEDLKELGLEWIMTDDYEVARNTESGSFIAGQERLQIDADDAGFTKGLRFLTGGPTGIEGATRAESDGTGLLGDVLSFSSVLTNPELMVVLHALAVSGGSDLLSAPRITTRSGIAASIEVVQEIIYPTEFEAQTAELILGSGGNNDIDADAGAGIVIFPESFETREVGVILNVTPTVGPDKYTIDLTLAPEVAELVDWIQYGTPPFNIPQPIFASRNATTSIVIWDGQTIVMGGLINEIITRFDDKIPFIGDLPIVGRLFRSEGEASRKRNLLIFVTARIVDPAGQVVNKPKQRADLTLSSDLSPVGSMISE